MKQLTRIAAAAGAAALVGLLLAPVPRHSTPTPVRRAAPPPAPWPPEAQASAEPSATPPAPPRPLGSGRVGAGSPSMQHLDPRRTNRSPFVAPAQPRVAWTHDAGGPVVAPPVVSGAAVIVASLGGKLSAVGLDGSPRWTRDLGERLYSGPLLHNEVIYLGVDGGAVVAVDARTGDTRWRLAVDGDADTAPAPTPDGLVLTAGRVVYGLRRDGTVRWRYKHRRKLFASPAVADDGTAYVGAQDGSLLALTHEGSLRWRAQLGSDADGSPAVADDGTVYAGTDAGEVVALAPNDGAVRWRASLGGYVRGPLSVARDGAVLASTYGPSPAVFALDGATGAVRWRFAVRGTGAKEFGIHGAPLEDAEGTLIFGAHDDVLYALTPEGTPRWKLQLGGDIDAAVTLSENVLFVGSGDGRLYALH